MKKGFKFEKIDQKALKEKASQGIHLWAVAETAHPEVPITFTATKEQAYIAIDQHIYLKHYKHYRLWCNQRDLPIDHSESWKKYCSDVLAEELIASASTYTVIKVHYSASIIASLLRAMNNCIPMGCPFDTEEEIRDFSDYLDHKLDLVEDGADHLTEIEEGLVALLDDVEAELDPSAPEVSSDPQASAFIEKKRAKKEAGFDA